MGTAPDGARRMRLIRGRAAGFSLVELLAVVAIILILLTLLLPLLQPVQRQARLAKCQANLRQLYAGMLFDLQSRDISRFPSYQNGRLWMDDVAAGLRDEKKMEAIRFCPEATTPSAGFAASSKHAWTWNSTSLNRGSYGLNGWMYHPYGGGAGSNGGAGYYFGNANWPGGFWETVSEAGAKAPMFADCSWVDGWPFDDDIVPPDPNVGIASAERPTYMARFCISRHGSRGSPGINLVFCDGHVSFVSLDMLWSLKWNKTFKTQGRKVPFP